jgi:hypothetical protein
MALGISERREVRLSCGPFIALSARAAKPLICIVPIFVVTAILFANEIAATSFGFSDFGVVAMAKIRPPL